MAEQIKKGWLYTREDEKFAPNTLVENVYTRSGTPYDEQVRNYFEAVRRANATTEGETAAKLKEHTQRLNALDKDIENLQKEDVSLDARLDAEEATSKSHGGRLDTIEQDIRDLKQEDINLDSRLDVEEQTSTEHDSRLDKLETKTQYQDITNEKTFFIVDKDDRAIFYVDTAGIKSVEYHIKNATYDTNLSTVIGRVGALEDRATDIETDLAQEVADRKDSVLYVALGTASKTTQLRNQAIGVDGVLAVTNGGIGHSSWTKNRIVYASATNALEQLAAGTAGQYLRSGGTGAPSWSSTIVVQVNPSTTPTEVGAIWITT